MGSAIVTSLSIILALAFVLPADGAGRASTAEVAGRSAARAKPLATMAGVGTRYVGAPIEIRGRTWRIAGRHKLELQRYSAASSRWYTVAKRFVRQGLYSFPSQRWGRPGNVAFRTVLFARGRPVSVSKVIHVHVVARPVSPTTPQPDAVEQERTVVAPYCPHLTVTTSHQTRTVNWRWDGTARRWVEDPTPWVTDSTSERAASADDCVHILNQVPANAALPDLRIQDLTHCTSRDMQDTHGTCFLIDPAAPYNSDYPALEGKKLLKFGVVTINAGAGASEIIADRSAADSTDWSAYQSFYDAQGKRLGSVVDPNVQYYFAGDGHNHWHVRDFDQYSLLDADGTTVARAEKHGYCMWDNNGPLRQGTGVPTEPVYTADTSCGKGLPNALTIIHGLSQGWGDTYFSYLPDQALDITGLPDGEYTVEVHADVAGAVTESNDNNNTARVKVKIAGNNVTVVPGSSSGA